MFRLVLTAPHGSGNSYTTRPTDKQAGARKVHLPQRLPVRTPEAEIPVQADSSRDFSLASTLLCLPLPHGHSFL